jgi:phage/conjugal plasmid C-4 type zinc finger TraR family protein
MADEIDAAQAADAQHREMSLRRHLLRRNQRGTDDCVACGEPIPKERKRALPSARRCVTCQESFERAQRLRR